MRQSSIDNLVRLATREGYSALRPAVLAAHPDDETIGASAVLARFPEAHVIFLTDGAPHNKKLWPPEMRRPREHYAEVRREEARRALAHAGIADEQLHWLGAVDQEATLSARNLAQRLTDLLRKLRPGVLITHPYEGGHPDHDCAALVARIAIECLDSEPPLLCEMTSYHARDGQCVTGEFLNSQSSNEWVLDLTDGDRERKRRMMSEYSSQRLVLENFPIIAERLRVAPQYDFTKPPHDGRLWYEHTGWMAGERWRELAARACANTQECSCD